MAVDCLAHGWHSSVNLPCPVCDAAINAPAITPYHFYAGLALHALLMRNNVLGAGIHRGDGQAASFAQQLASEMVKREAGR